MSERVVILTGAGISAESGLGTFRDKDWLWTKYDLRDVATPEGFARNPKFVLEFYAARRGNLLLARGKKLSGDETECLRRAVAEITRRGWKK